MKDSEIYKNLQRLVVESADISTDDKLEVLKLLFEREDLALYMEGKEGQDGKL